MENILKIDPEKVETFLVDFIINAFTSSNFNIAIIGISGGVDSAVVASLCKKSLGKKNTYGIILPYKNTTKTNLDHAYHVCKTLDIKYLKFDITPQIDSYFKNFPQANNIRRGNKISRERMSILYDLSAHFSGLVVGTSNKSEIYLGYGTLYGDLACAINPLGDLYKTQVYQLAEYLDIPKEIRDKKPSADLWPGQTDEEELGFTYEEADKVLYYYIDEKMEPSEIIKNKKINEGIVKKVIERIKNSEFKRRLPLIPKLPSKF